MRIGWRKRKRNGSLSYRESEGVAKLKKEVWEVIKHDTGLAFRRHGVLIFADEIRETPSGIDLYYHGLWVGHIGLTFNRLKWVVKDGRN